MKAVLTDSCSWSLGVAKMLNHKHAQVFIETFLYAYYGKKNVYIKDATNVLRNAGRPDAFTNFSFVIGANFRAGETQFAHDVMDLLVVALNENFDGGDVGLDWTKLTEANGCEFTASGFPEARICVNVY